MFNLWSLASSLRFLNLNSVLGLFFFITSCDQFMKTGTKPKITLLVEDRLAPELSENVKQYQSDLEAEGYNVTLNMKVSETTHHSQIRAILQDEYRNDKNLEGAVLVGKLAAPLYNEIHHEGDTYWHDHLSDLYYMDLDGIWEDRNDNGVYDSHRNSQSNFVDRLIRIAKKTRIFRSRRAPEIWVSRIRADTLASGDHEIALLKAYFVKNHYYRTGEMPLPPRRAFIFSPTIDVLRSGWGARPNELYSDISIVEHSSDGMKALRELLQSEEGYEWGVIAVFSGPRIHHLNDKDIEPLLWKSKEGRRRITEYLDEIHGSEDVTWLDIKVIKPRVLFYHLLTSQAGRHDHNDYLAGTYVFNGSGLAAIAGTQHSGATGVPSFYKSLARGKTIGGAWRDAMVRSIGNSGKKITVYRRDGSQKWTAGTGPYKAVLIGDGTLRLPAAGQGP